MADPFRKINAGDAYPTSAAYRNAVVEMVRWWKSQGGAGGARIRQQNQQASIVDVKNVSGSDLPRFSALTITDVFPQPADNEKTFANGPILHGTSPTTDTDPDNLVVLLKPARNNAIVPACVDGVCVAKVEIGSEDNATCGIKSETAYVLQGGLPGAKILWKESGTGTKWCVVRVGGGDSGDVRCTCLLKGALLTSAETATVDNVQVICGTSPLDDPDSASEEMTIYNTHDWEGDDEGLARFEWNKTTEHWEFYQVTCPA